MKPRHFNHVVGVDLGGGKGKKTALATLRVDAAGATVVEIAPREGERPFYDTTLVDTIRQFGEDTLLCLDAPLTLPPCLRCTVPVCPGQTACVDPAVVAMRAIVAEAAEADPELTGGRNGRRGKPAVTPYTQRATEVYLAHRLGIVPREALGQGTGPLAARAAHLARALADRFTLNETLLEVYPKGTLAALGFTKPYKKHLHERETRAHILRAAVGRPALRPRRVARGSACRATTSSRPSSARTRAICGRATRGKRPPRTQVCSRAGGSGHRPSRPRPPCAAGSEG